MAILVRVTAVLIHNMDGAEGLELTRQLQQSYGFTFNLNIEPSWFYI